MILWPLLAVITNKAASLLPGPVLYYQNEGFRLCLHDIRSTQHTVVGTHMVIGNAIVP